MKIKPVKDNIQEIIKEYGSVILLLGTRTDESSGRGQRMNARELSSRNLNPHHEIPNALVLSPISEWTSDQVWEYLFTNDPPWGGNHEFMLNLYRQANGGECPVVVDLNTPSCGGSRFGCWTCTVVKVRRPRHPGQPVEETGAGGDPGGVFGSAGEAQAGQQGEVDELHRQVGQLGA
jgi:DNA sulfur modification protein DndC